MQKTILMSPCDKTISGGMPRGILSIELTDQTLYGKLRLYNMNVSQQDGKIGAYINNRVYRAELQPLEKNLFSFKILNINAANGEMFFALIVKTNVTLCGGNYTDSIVNIREYFDSNSFSDRVSDNIDLNASNTQTYNSFDEQDDHIINTFNKQNDHVSNNFNERNDHIKNTFDEQNNDLDSSDIQNSNRTNLKKTYKNLNTDADLDNTLNNQFPFNDAAPTAFSDKNSQIKQNQTNKNSTESFLGQRNQFGKKNMFEQNQSDNILFQSDNDLFKQNNHSGYKSMFKKDAKDFLKDSSNDLESGSPYSDDMSYDEIAQHDMEQFFMQKEMIDRLKNSAQTSDNENYFRNDNENNFKSTKFNTNYDRLKNNKQTSNDFQTQGALSDNDISQYDMLKQNSSSKTNTNQSDMTKQDTKSKTNSNDIKVSKQNFSNNPKSPVPSGSIKDPSFFGSDINYSHTGRQYPDNTDTNNLKTQKTSAQDSYQNENVNNAQNSAGLEEIIQDKANNLNEENIKNKENIKNTNSETNTQNFSDFFENINEQINELLENYPTDTELENIIPDAKFVRINDSQTNSYYVLGVLYQKNKIKYIAYGVPGTFNSDPPVELQNKSQWLPLDITDPLSDGYYLIYQDATTGNLVDIEIK